MLLWIRIIVVSALLGVALSACWYPAASLVEIQPVNWGKEHEARYLPARPSRFPLGGAGRALLEQTARSRPFMPLSEYLHQQLGEDWATSLITEPGTLMLPGPGTESAWLRPEEADSESLSSAWQPLLVQDAGALEFYRWRQMDPLQSSARIPAERMFPYRSGWLVPALLLSALVLFAWRLPSSTAQGSNVGRAFRFGTSMAVFFTILSLFLAVIGQRAAPDVVYAGLLVSVFLAVCGIVIVIIYGLMLSWLSRLLNGQGLLAHWEFSSDEWNGFVQRDFQFSRRNNLARLLLIGVMIVLVGVGFAILAPDGAAGGMVMLVMLGLLFILALVALLLPAWTRRRMLRAQPAVWVGQEGVCVGNQAQRWTGFGSRFESAELQQRKEALAQLSVTYSAVRRMSGPLGVQRFRDHHTVNIPVPRGRERDAAEIVDRLARASA